MVIRRVLTVTCDAPDCPAAVTPGTGARGWLIGHPHLGDLCPDHTPEHAAGDLAEYGTTTPGTPKKGWLGRALDAYLAN